MKKAGKKYQEKAQQIDRSIAYKLAEAVKKVKESAWAKFDESVDLAVKLGFDLKKAGGSLRGTLVMPAGMGKEKKVAVIAKGDKITEAEKAGAEVVGSTDLVEKIQAGFLGFDVLIATPDMMGVVGRLGKLLGTKGLMPNPKTGTVTFDVAQTVKEFKAGKTEFKADKNGVVHLLVGKVSFGEEKLRDNLLAALRAIYKAKPSGGIKGVFFKSLYLSSTMGPSVKLDVNEALETVGARED